MWVSLSAGLLSIKTCWPCFPNSCRYRLRLRLFSKDHSGSGRCWSSRSKADTNFHTLVLCTDRWFHVAKYFQSSLQPQLSPCQVSCDVLMYTMPGFVQISSIMQFPIKSAMASIFTCVSPKLLLYDYKKAAINILSLPSWPFCNRAGNSRFFNFGRSGNGLISLHGLTWNTASEEDIRDRYTLHNRSESLCLVRFPLISIAQLRPVEQRLFMNGWAEINAAASQLRIENP